MWSNNDVKYDKFALWGILALGQKGEDSSMHCDIKGISSGRLFQKDAIYCSVTNGSAKFLNVARSLHFNVSLRMFTRRVVIQRRVEDLQLGVESYQKKLNLTKPDTYRSNLRRQDAYTPYSDPRGFIYENKDKKNRLMRIDELHKFSDGTLDDVRTALNDRLKVMSDMKTVMDPGAMHKPLLLLKSQKDFVSKLTGRYTIYIDLFHSELVDIEKVAVCSSLRSLKSKCTIESRAKRDHP
ncbi:hypothetical protein Tco_0850625 [Tanacetum coccineum]